jgi:hypothetical protein
MTTTHDFSVEGDPSVLVLNPHPYAMTVTRNGQMLPGREAAHVPAADPVAMRLVFNAVLIGDYATMGTPPVQPPEDPPVEKVVAPPKNRRSKSKAAPAPKVDPVIDNTPAEVETLTVEADADTADISDGYIPAQYPTFKHAE